MEAEGSGACGEEGRKEDGAVLSVLGGRPYKQNFWNRRGGRPDSVSVEVMLLCSFICTRLLLIVSEKQKRFPRI